MAYAPGSGHAALSLSRFAILTKTRVTIVDGVRMHARSGLRVDGTLGLSGVLRIES
jgi:hypothetical protein